MHIDFLSLSFPLIQIENYQQAVWFIQEFFGEELFSKNVDIWKKTSVQYGMGRAPYSSSINTPLGILFWSPRKKGCLLEMGGNACSKLTLSEMIEMVGKNKVTRIDLAHDFTIHDTTYHPEAVCANPKTKSIGINRSETGVTVYLGSPKSDSQSRVYEYFAPNQRAGLTRVEHVFRRKYAQAVVKALINGYAVNLFNQKSESLGLTENVLLDVQKMPKISMTAGLEPKTSKRLQWLKKSVFPLINRLLEEEVITVNDIITRDNIQRWIDQVPF